VLAGQTKCHRGEIRPPPAFRVSFICAVLIIRNNVVSCPIPAWPIVHVLASASLVARTLQMPKVKYLCDKRQFWIYAPLCVLVCVLVYFIHFQPPVLKAAELGILCLFA